jgi:hypothetical protein
MRVGDPLRRLVAERAVFRCEYCHYPEEFSPSSFEVEHIKPKSADGLTELDNLALACSHCNAHKATRQAGIDPLAKVNVPLFNPRTDVWSNHFVLNQNNGEIEGLTAVGRTTVEVLDMNAEQPTRARLNLIRLDVFGI